MTRRSILAALGSMFLIALAFVATARDGDKPPLPLPPMPPPFKPHPSRFTNAVTPAASAVDALAWDALSKEMETKPGQMSADFDFWVTNISTAPVVIDHVQTSCGCTVAKLPSQPWTLKPQENGKIGVSVDLRGKQGTFLKTVTVFLAGAAMKQLTVKVSIPNNPENARLQNQQMATADHQKVFKGDCARCHVAPAQGKTGKDLYAAACGICHEAEHRASMVPDLHAMNHSTDKIYWKQWITLGKPGSAMPGFGLRQGGPLTAEQIDSLVEYLDGAIPHNPQGGPTAQLEGKAASAFPGSAPAPVIK